MNRKSNFWLSLQKGRLSVKLMSYIILCSLFFALLTSTYQLYSEYQRDTNIVYENLKFVEDSYVPAITISAYRFDDEQVHIQLQGALQLQDIVYLEVRQARGGEAYLITKGNPETPNEIFREYPLVFAEADAQPQPFGSLFVKASLVGAQQRLWERAGVILAANVASIFLVTLVIFLIIQFVLTRHLIFMANYTQQLNLNELDTALVLSGKDSASTKPDELDQLALTINNMRLRLKEGIAELKRAEEQIRNHNILLEGAVQNKTQELRVAKDAAETAREKAEVANQSKSVFLANMSHELRTPMNAILGFSQLMERDPALSRTQQESLTVIIHSGEHLLALINDVLEMSKIEAGHVTLAITNFDLAQILTSIEAMFCLKVEGKNLILSFELAPNLPQYIRTDEQKLQQVLINLLGNAIKFTEMGRVTLRVMYQYLGGGAGEAGSNGELPTFQRERGQLFFEIEDTGFGIATEELDIIFKAFGQSESGQKSIEGTGLGLPISRQFVQLMGGDISVSSTLKTEGVEQHGTTFKFDIQVELITVASELTKQASQRVIALEDNQPTYRILVVEDHFESRILLVKLLQSVGFEVRQAVNGQEGVKEWQAWQPHFIWMDMYMPLLDGYQATQQIKATAQETQKQAPVIIALTANVFDDEVHKVLEAGCDDFLLKPYKEADIFAKMSASLGVRYIYEEKLPAEFRHETDQETEERDHQNLIPLLATLPTEWLNSFHYAVEIIDMEATYSLIKQIEQNSEQLALALNEFVDNYQFDVLIELMEQVNVVLPN